MTSTTLYGYCSSYRRTTSKSFHSPAGRAVRSVARCALSLFLLHYLRPFSERFSRSRFTQAQCSPAPPDGSYHAAARCSIDWESTTQLILSEERGMRCCEEQPMSAHPLCLNPRLLSRIEVLLYTAGMYTSHVSSPLSLHSPHKTCALRSQLHQPT
jgi:hypothetical protein